MVVLDARKLDTEDPGRVQSAPLLNGRTDLSRAKPRGRTNPYSVHDSPPGFMRCKTPSCSELISREQLLEGIAMCSLGHVIDVTEEERRHLEEPGGYSLVGLSNKAQGDIAELIVQRLKSLGDFGDISEWMGERHPLDGVTSKGWGIEVKSVNGPMARNHAFTRSTKRATAKKHAEMRKRKLKGLVGVLVILDFGTSEAIIYLRGMKKMTYFERPRTEPFAIVDFTDINPFVQEARQHEMDLAGDDIPF